MVQFAKNEQNMNAVERAIHLSQLPPEGPPSTLDDPPISWPARGQISFTGVGMAYRQTLPLILKSVSFTINPGEKVGSFSHQSQGERN